MRDKPCGYVGQAQSLTIRVQSFPPGRPSYGDASWSQNGYAALEICEIRGLGRPVVEERLRSDLEQSLDDI
jgi:hypothetical protein